MENKVITLRSAYKVKEYHFQPCKMANGMNYPFVKPVTYDINGNPQLLLSEAERNNPDSQYFIPEDMDIVVMDGTTFNLSDPLQKNKWLAIKDSSLIVPARDARDENGNLRIDGDKTRYGMAELWVDIPGEESERSVTKRKLIIRAQTFIMEDSFDGRLTKCKLLGRNFKNAPASDVEDYLYNKAESNPQMVIDLYTNGDTALQLLFIDAKERNVITKQHGLFMYGDTNLGATDDSVILFFKIPENKTILDLIKRDTYPEFVQKITKSGSKKTETEKE
jgi:hypothetical protein